MVTDDDMLIITHCFRAGISSRVLSLCFQTSPQTIRRIASEGDRCSHPIFDRYFHLGSQAEYTLQRLRASFGVRYAHTETQTEAEIPGDENDEMRPSSFYSFEARSHAREIKKKNEREPLRS